MPIKKLQMKAGTPVTLLQLLISTILLFAAAVGLYVKAEVRAQNMEDRVNAIEKTMNKNESNAIIRKTSRDEEIRNHDDRITKNTQDIEILKVVKQDKK
jgi:hypothetical protein